MQREVVGPEGTVRTALRFGFAVQNDALLLSHGKIHGAGAECCPPCVVVPDHKGICGCAHRALMSGAQEPAFPV